MYGTVAAKTIVDHPYFSMMCALALFFILPQYGSMVLMCACAGILSCYVVVLPEHFRSRSGSLFPATCLVAAMWIAAAVISVMALLGEIQG